MRVSSSEASKGMSGGHQRPAVLVTHRGPGLGSEPLGRRRESNRSPPHPRAVPEAAPVVYQTVTRQKKVAEKRVTFSSKRQDPTPFLSSFLLQVLGPQTSGQVPVMVANRCPAILIRGVENVEWEVAKPRRP